MTCDKYVICIPCCCWVWVRGDFGLVWFGLVISGFEKVENGEGFACGNWRMRQREMGVGKGFPNGIGNGRWVGRRA